MDSLEFLDAMNTLLYSWGGDTPVEAIWAANKFLDLFKKLKNKDYDLYFTTEDFDQNEDVLSEISIW